MASHKDLYWNHFYLLIYTSSQLKKNPSQLSVHRQKNKSKKTKPFASWVRLWSLKCFLCRQHTRFWKINWFIIFIHPLSSTAVCHAASLHISDYVVDKQAHIWLPYAETTSAMKSMPCPENSKNVNDYSYDSLLLFAWASFANIEHIYNIYNRSQHCNTPTQLL